MLSFSSAHDAKVTLERIVFSPVGFHFGASADVGGGGGGDNEFQVCRSKSRLFLHCGLFISDSASSRFPFVTSCASIVAAPSPPLTRIATFSLVVQWTLAPEALGGDAPATKTLFRASNTWRSNGCRRPKSEQQATRR